MKTGMDTFLDGAGHLIETVPELYDDAVKPTAQEVGKTISILPKTINAALVPLRKWIAEREYNIDETEKILEKKLERVEIDKIVTPDAYVAVPALQAISYSMNSDELRNMYANLLANAMNIERKEMVHPAFVELIKQMSPKDARILELIFSAKITPLIDLGVIGDDGGISEQKYNFTWMEIFSYEEIAICINNLERMGLIEIPYGDKYIQDSNYNFVRNTKAYAGYKLQLDNSPNGKTKETKKYIKKTALAYRFYEICIKNKA